MPKEDEVETDLKGYAAVIDLYYGAIDEARRVLRRKGILVVKTQDQR